MFAVTTETLPGHEIKEILGGVLGTIARPQNPYIEGIKKPSGGFGEQIPQSLRRWRSDAIELMLEDARQRGANAVVGLRFDHRAVGDAWMEICAYGTAVFAVPDDSRPSG